MASKPNFEQTPDAAMFVMVAPVGHDHVAGTGPCGCGLETAGAAFDIYNEEAFRYFLDVERKRSEASNRPFLLLLLDLRKKSAPSADIDPPAASTLFATLASCLRETDFVGWYHAGSVIGAVLTQHAEPVSTDVQAAVRDRLVEAIRKNVPGDLAHRVQVRVYRLPAAIQAH